jgi:hypothetical protein
MPAIRTIGAAILSLSLVKSPSYPDVAARAAFLRPLTWVLVFFLATLRDSLRTRVGLQAEVLALRHQLLVLQRRNQKRRLQLSAFDRLLWVWLSRMWADWKSALRIVKPETVIAWHRKGFRLYWRWKSRPRHGRPPVTTEVRESDSTHQHRQSRLGCTTHSRRVGQTRHQGLGDNGCQVHGAAPAPAFPDVACLLEQSRQGSGLRRFLRGPDRYVSLAVCVRHPFS